MWKTKKEKTEAAIAAEAYWKQATDFVRRITDDPESPPWFIVTDDTAEQLKSWERYFDWRLGFQPWGMKMLKRQQINQFLTPCEWPEWFDARFQSKASA
jgi:hypothetical protein